MSSIILVKQTNGYTEMAILTAANSFKNIAMIAPTKLTRESLPLLSNRMVKRDATSYETAFFTEPSLYRGLGIVRCDPDSSLRGSAPLSLWKKL